MSRDHPLADVLDLDEFEPGVVIDPDWQPPTRLAGVLAVRARDHLMFGVSWVELTLSTRGAMRLTASSDGFLILTFAPQSLTEKAYFQRLDGTKNLEVNPGNNEGQSPIREVPGTGVPGTGEDSIERPPIRHRLSQESRLVFKVPKGTTIPFTIEGILQAAGTLELSVPVNALPRERRFYGVFVPAPFLVGEVIAARGAQNRFESLMTAGRIRERVRAPGPLMAAPSDAYTDLLAPGLIVATEEGGSQASIEGRVVTEVGRSAIEEVIAGLRRLRPKPAPPRATQTAIEAPYRLIVSPSRLGGWAHSGQIIEHQGRVELWHTRLGVRDAEDPEAVVVDETSPFQRVIRAVWARESFGLEDYTDTPDAYPGGNNPFRSALDERDRHNLVHLSSNFSIVQAHKRYLPEPVGVNRLMLTALGAWMDLAGRWDPWPTGLSVEEWLHRATLGRDHYVRVVYQGFLVPFGHRATLIKVTERMFASDVPGKDWGQTDNPAYLIQRMFIVVKEPEKTYGDSTTFDGGKHFANAMPFKSVRVTDRQTPDLDRPEDSDGNPAKSSSAFWPCVDGEPFMFHVVGTDVEGNESKFAMPLLFVDKTVDENKSSLTNLLNEYSQRTGIPSQPNHISLNGQQIAYAQAKAVDDTSYETTAIRFGASIPDGQAFGGSSVGPRFRPRIQEAILQIPPIRHLTATDAPLTVEYDEQYLRHGFTVGNGSQNPGELLLKAKTAVDLNLSAKTDRTGGLATPSMKISGLSRKIGPVAGDLNTIQGFAFDPKQFFQGASAYLFGVIPLADVVAKLDFVTDLARVPRFIGKRLDRIEAFLDDLSRIHALLEGYPPLWNVVSTQVDGVVDAIQDILAGNPSDVGAAIGLLDGQLELLHQALPGPLPLGLAGEVTALVDRLRVIVDEAADLVALVEQLRKGIEIPRAMSSRFEWRPQLTPWPNSSDPIFDPHSDLILAVEARGSVDQGGDLVISAVLEDFDLNMVAPARFLVIHFEKIQMLIRNGHKPEIDVVMGEIQFVGVLSFVETLKDLIPLDAFSDPPAVQVDASGIRADLSVGLPNVSVGVFSLENLSLGGGFAVPFVGKPLSVYFRFCERENPALLSVSLFAGGFFFGITLDPKGIQILEAALEFGANVSMDFGVASGGVSVMAGLYFKMEADKATLAGYFRARGHVRALGIVTVSIELYLEMSYETATKKCVGRAKLSISIELFMFETTISISCEKKFAGSGDDPTFLEAMGPYPLDPVDPTSSLVKPWEEYCAAFA